MAFLENSGLGPQIPGKWQLVALAIVFPIFYVSSSNLLRLRHALTASQAKSLTLKYKFLDLGCVNLSPHPPSSCEISGALLVEDLRMADSTPERWRKSAP